MAPAAGGGEPSRSASAIVSDTVSGYHILRIEAYSRTKAATPTGEYLKSLPFTVGGHLWGIRYYPNGDRSEVKDYISLYLFLDESVTEPVKAQFHFRFVGDVDQQAVTLEGVRSFGTQGCWGFSKFNKREDLEASKHLRDDSFAIRCDVVVINEFRAKEVPEVTIQPSVSVPPSDLHQHLGNILQTEKGADVVFDVAGQTFAAHRCVLAARSPVFSAELFGMMKESDTGGVVRIEDMEAPVFKALLYFIYTDLFPKATKQDGDLDEDVLSQHLLVAADRYNLERLKLLCEKKLCDYIDVDTVATILALAEQHCCHGLTKVCFHFLSSPANLMAVMASDGFKHLSRSCPSVMEELISMLAQVMTTTAQMAAQALFAMSPAAAGGEPSRSTSAIIAETASGYHILRIDAYSRTKAAIPTGEFLESVQFTVGGRRWSIRYYPNGHRSEYRDYISLFLCLDESVAREVKAQFEFSFVADVDQQQAVTLGEANSFGRQGSWVWGNCDFITRQDLEASKHLRHDSFAVRCDLVVINEFRAEELPEFTIPPPSDLHQHLGSLLRTEKGADVVFDVTGQTFAAHRCVLAARSPVFSAALFGVMKEGDTGGVVHIEDMEAPVFKALLYFIYTDLFPKATKDLDEDVLSQHLLVAADRYNLERLKLFCEYIDVGTVATILALAEQHRCHGLKKVCFHFLSSPANVMAVTASDGFKHLSRSCPSVMEELISML
ncbi:hypothetical protein U9M48_009840, partial [Paspalum notatum var. saurae]